MRRTPLRRKSQRKQKKVRKLKDAYKVPSWFMELPLGSHGNTPAQKRYWKVVSDTYRKADFEQYDGRCVSCHRRLEHWKEGHLAHFKKWSVCNSWFKFARENLALSCSYCNYLDDGVVGHEFGEELIRRYGKGHLEWIERENQKYKGQKMEVWELVARTEKLLHAN